MDSSLMNCTLSPDSCPSPSICFPSRNDTCACLGNFGYQNPPSCITPSVATQVTIVFLFVLCIGSAIMASYGSILAVTFLTSLRQSNKTPSDLAIFTLIVLLSMWLLFIFYLLSLIGYMNPTWVSYEKHSSERETHRVVFLFTARMSLLLVGIFFVIFSCILIGGTWFQLGNDARKLIPTQKRTSINVRRKSLVAAGIMFVIFVILFALDEIGIMNYFLGGVGGVVIIFFSMGSIHLTRTLNEIDKTGSRESSQDALPLFRKVTRKTQRATNLCVAALLMALCGTVMLGFRPSQGVYGQEGSIAENPVICIGNILSFYGLWFVTLVLFDFGKTSLQGGKTVIRVTTNGNTTDKAIVVANLNIADANLNTDSAVVMANGKAMDQPRE